MDKPAAKRLESVLWFVAAALALTAFAIDYSRDPAPRWTTAAAAAFCVVMALASLRKRRRGPPTA